MKGGIVTAKYYDFYNQGQMWLAQTLKKIWAVGLFRSYVSFSPFFCLFSFIFFFKIEIVRW